MQASNRLAKPAVPIQSSIIVFLFLLLLLTGMSPVAHSQILKEAPPGVVDTNGFNFWVVATRTDNHQQKVYDDNINANDYWPCGRKYFFPAYAGDPIDLEIRSFNSSYHDFTLMIWENGVYTDTIYNIDLFTPFQITFTTKGEKFLEFSNPYSLPPMYMTSRMTVIPKLEKMWLEVPEICANTWISSQYLPITFRSVPSLSDMAIQTFSGGHMYYDNVGSCHSGHDLEFAFTDGSGSPIVGMLNGVYYMENLLHVFDTVGAIQDTNLIKSNLTGSGESIPLAFTFDDGIQNHTVNSKVIFKGPHASFTAPTTPNDWYDFDSLVVTGNETWTADDNPTKAVYGVGTSKSKLRVNKYIRISPGANLTVEDITIEMGPEAKIRVQATAGSSNHGGKLTLNNATVTSYRDCGNEDEQWTGIVVEGNASKSQEVITANGNGADRYQGTLIMTNSTLSYADNAVRLAADDPSDWMMTRSGGVVIANNCTFYNNRRSVEFMKYLYTSTGTPAMLKPNASKFTKCHFGLDNNYTSTNKFSAFMTGWGVRGVLVTGCNFENSGYTDNLNTKGIYGIDFGVTVNSHWAGSVQTPTLFSSLKYAVEDKMAAIPVGLIVSQSDFRDNMRGVTSSGMMAPIIKENTIGNAAPSIAGLSAGVTINTGSGYKIAENTVRNGSIGVLVTNSGSDNNVVRRNSFSDLGTGGLSNYKNMGYVNGQYPGLQFECNTHDALNYDIAALGANSSTDGIAALQGNLLTPAGNILYSSSLVNIYNPGAMVASINYFYYVGNASQNPNTNSDPNIIKTGTNNINECLDEGAIDYPSYPTNPGGVYAKIVALLGNTDEDGANKDSLYYWVEQWESPYGMLLKTDLLIEDGELEQASNEYNIITSTYELDEVEAGEFDDFGRSLLDIRIDLAEEEKSLLQLSGSQVELLENIVENAQLWAKVRAQNWLSLYDGREYDLPILYPEEESARPGAPATPKIKTEIEKGFNKVYPNPVTDFLQVYYTTENEVVLSMELYDVIGKKLYSISLNKGLNEVDVKGLTGGVYYYKMYEGTEVKMQGKLIKQ